MSLHHVRNLDDMTREINRVLNPGGIIIVREHDSVGQKFATILDVVHAFYGMVWSNPPEFENWSEYYAHYHSQKSLSQLMIQHNF